MGLGVTGERPGKVKPGEEKLGARAPRLLGERKRSGASAQVGANAGAFCFGRSEKGLPDETRLRPSASARPEAPVIGCRELTQGREYHGANTFPISIEHLR